MAQRRPIHETTLAAQRRAAARGFTLVELLVVIAILGVLMSLLLPAVNASRESARRAHCKSNLRQIGIGLHTYHDANKTFPVGCVKRNTLRLAWSAYLLPFVEEQGVWNIFDTKSAYNSVRNQTSARVAIPVYLCPSTVRTAVGRVGDTAGDKNNNGVVDPGDYLAMTDYGGVYGAARVSPPGNGMLLYDKSIALRAIRDGSSHTLIVAEDTGRGWSWDGEWANGENIFDRTKGINELQHNEFWSDHLGGAFGLYCDGSVRFLTENVDATLLDALCTRAGSEVVGSLGE